MNYRSTSLVEILQPPRNNWLRSLSRRKSNPPEGVRIVRFSNGYDDDDLEIAEPAAATGTSGHNLSPLAHSEAVASLP
jgi:hypothetical protein